MASKNVKNPQRRFQLWQILLGLASVALAYGAWETLLRPRYLLNKAVASLDEDPSQAAQLAEEAFASSFVAYPMAQLVWTRALLKSGKWDEAAGCFSLIETPERLPSEQLLELGDEAQRTGFPMLATFAFEAVPSQSLDHDRATDALIQIRGADRNWPEVVKLGSQVLAEDLAVESLFLIALAYESQIQLQQAQTFYRHVANANTTAELQDRAARALTRIAIRLGERDEANEWISKCRRKSESDWELQLMQAQLFRLRGDREAAMTAVKRILEALPKDHQANLLLGSLNLEAGQTVGAADQLRLAVQQDPYSKEAHYKLAIALRQLGELDEARLHLVENRELNEASLTILELQGRPPKDLSEAERTKKLAEAYERLGQYEIANQLRSSSR